MNIRSFSGVMAAIALMLTVSFSAQAQLGGALNRARNAVQSASGTAKEEEKPAPAATQSSTSGTVQASTATTPQQPWVVDKEERGRIHATYADGVLTFKGYGAMKGYHVLLMQGGVIKDDRPWAAYVKEIKSVVVEEEMTHLGDNVFYGCENLTSVSLPGTLENIAGAAFWGCKSLQTITLPKSLNFFTGGEVPDPEDLGATMSAGLFGQCTSLTEIKVADGNEKFKSVDGVLYFYLNAAAKVGDLAAYPAGRKDANFIVPDGIGSVMAGGFSFCEALKSVVLSPICTSIENSAFMGCTNLESITLKKPTGSSVKLGGKVFRGVDKNRFKIYVPKAMLENYTTRGDSYWKDEWKDQIVGQ